MELRSSVRLAGTSKKWYLSMSRAERPSAWVETCTSCTPHGYVVPGCAGDVDESSKQKQPYARMREPRSGNEGARCHKGPGEARLRTGPPPGRPSPLRGSGRRTYPDGHRARCARRGHAKGDARCHQAPVGATWRGPSLRMYRSLRVKRKLPCLSCALPEAGHPRHDGQLGSYVPGGPSGKEMPPLLDGQVADPFKVHLDTVDERRLHVIKGGTERCDIEVDADRFPGLAAPVRVTLELQSHPPSGTVSVHRATSNVNVRSFACFRQDHQLREGSSSRCHTA